eukprot:3497400-Amphidinium_carterae.1
MHFHCPEQHDGAVLFDGLRRLSQKYTRLTGSFTLTVQVSLCQQGYCGAEPERHATTNGRVLFVHAHVYISLIT